MMLSQSHWKLPITLYLDAHIPFQHVTPEMDGQTRCGHDRRLTERGCITCVADKVCTPLIAGLRYTRSDSPGFTVALLSDPHFFCDGHPSDASDWNRLNRLFVTKCDGECTGSYGPKTFFQTSGECDPLTRCPRLGSDSTHLLYSHLSLPKIPDRVTVVVAAPRQTRLDHVSVLLSVCAAAASRMQGEEKTCYIV
jgi:hypothetical protein